MYGILLSLANLALALAYRRLSVPSLGKDSKKMRKIVMKVQMNCRKCERKALKIAATEDGVSSVALGDEKDRVVVTGEGVDAVKLAKSLRKKFKAADIITVADVK